MESGTFLPFACDRISQNLSIEDGDRTCGDSARSRAETGPLSEGFVPLVRNYFPLGLDVGEHGARWPRASRPYVFSFEYTPLALARLVMLSAGLLVRFAVPLKRRSPGHFLSNRRRSFPESNRIQHRPVPDRRSLGIQALISRVHWRPDVLRAPSLASRELRSDMPRTSQGDSHHHKGRIVGRSDVFQGLRTNASPAPHESGSTLAQSRPSARIRQEPSAAVMASRRREHR
ncbi:hypothetical protein C8Q70DRAFT_554001 [Cubamyces menziesii]|nr:hypothetical protein C8Q70DRAFT_554001 [Cubamyces menziesii]